MAELGGEAAVLAESEALALGPHFGLVVEALLRDWGSIQDRQSATALVAAGLLGSESLLQIKTVVDELLLAGDALRDVASDLMPALLTRASRRDSTQDAAIAAAALEGALRIVLGGWAGDRLTVAGLMAGVTASEDELFAVPATRLVGAAYEQWRFDELKGSLDRLGRVESASQDARHELAVAKLVDALDAVDESELVAGLEEAAAMFAAAGREDSQTLGLAVRAVARSRSGSGEGLAEARADLERRVRQRQMYLHGMHRPWLAPRADAEVAWVRLVDGLAAVEARPSSSVAEAAGDLLHAFSATRSMHLLMRADDRTAVPVILDPAIESHLLNQAELTAAVIRACEAVAEDDPDRAAADTLLALALSGKKNGSTEFWRSTPS